MRERPKPPQKTKAELMPLALEAIVAKYPLNPEAAIMYLLNYFTAIDLVEIIKETKE